MFRTLIDQSHDVIEVVDPETLRFLDINERACLDLGYSRAEFLALTVPDIDPVFDLSASRQFVKELRKSGSMLVESQHRRKDGSRFPVEINFKYVQLGRGYIITVVRDITERKQTEELIRKNEARLLEAQRVGHVGNWDWNITTNELYWSGENYRIYGLSPEVRPSVETFLETVDPVDLEFVKQSIDAALSGKKPYDIDMRIIRPDGLKRTVHARAEVTFDGAGKPIRMFGTVQDVTERTRAEAELRANEEQYRNLIEQMSDGVYKSSHAGKFIEVNPAMVKILGYASKEELLAIDIKSQLYFDVADRESAALQERLEEMAVFRLKKKDGSGIWVEDHGRHVLDEDGSVLYHEGTLRDVTERIRAETLQDAVYRIARAAETAKALSDLYPQIHQIISSVMSAENFFITLYDETQNLLHFPYFQDAVDEPYLGKLQPGKGLTAYVLRTGKSLLCTQAVHDELERRGEVILVGVPSKIWLGVPLIVDGKTIGAMVVQHYSDPKAYGEREQHMLEFVSSQVAIAITRKQAEEEIQRYTVELEQRVAQRTAELSRANAELKELDRMKDHFVSMVSHEFRTPLTVILASSDILELDSDKLTADKKRNYLHRIQSSVKRMAEMLGQVLVIGQADAGKLAFNPTPLNLLKFCQNLVEELQMSTGKDHALVFISHGECINANMDTTLLRHILSNLLSNAIKYSPIGSPIELELSCQAEHAVLRVSDHGLGIPLKDQSHLFETFFRASNTEAISGTGLGLTIVKRAVDLHGGTIEVTSQEGVGTTMTVTLPIDRSAATQENH
jgi:PAS domain S-box-containing protein